MYRYELEQPSFFLSADSTSFDESRNLMQLCENHFSPTGVSSASASSASQPPPSSQIIKTSNVSVNGFSSPCEKVLAVIWETKKQPGAAKTTMADLFTGVHAGNIIFISGDAYRPFHPHMAELRVHFGDDAVLHTQEFAGRMTEAL